ncbi:hypothetical protein BDR07DRAFT_1463853 [Suillus spraguei]|nr:hypothetical protein BDR07DRAFT_1463853 [Suillus spraguei]
MSDKLPSKTYIQLSNSRRFNLSSFATFKVELFDKDFKAAKVISSTFNPIFLCPTIGKQCTMRMSGGIMRSRLTRVLEKKREHDQAVSSQRGGGPPCNSSLRGAITRTIDTIGKSGGLQDISTSSVPSELNDLRIAMASLYLVYVLHAAFPALFHQGINNSSSIAVSRVIDTLFIPIARAIHPLDANSAKKMSKAVKETRSVRECIALELIRALELLYPTGTTVSADGTMDNNATLEEASRGSKDSLALCSTIPACPFLVDILQLVGAYIRCPEYPPCEILVCLSATNKPYNAVSNIYYNEKCGTGAIVGQQPFKFEGL